MATTTLYRIIDTDRCGQILANNIPTQTQAQELLALLRKDYPDLILAVESYTINESTD
jgi:hypothetical protein